VAPRPPRIHIRIVRLFAFGLLATGLVVVAAQARSVREIEVTATAYNSLATQTNEQPTVTAWGDRLEPGMKSIAVSRDLIDLGLTHGVEVEIVGLEGAYVVRDKMAERWRHKIDIYMGEDVQAARRWGVRRVTIRWTPE
jgi:3D (Asp-Asp-Asp) domain-containing protein